MGTQMEGKVGAEAITSKDKLTVARDSPAPLPEQCGEERAGCCSRPFYSWMDPLIKLASKKILQYEDLPDIMDSDKADVQREKFLVAWKRQKGEKSIVAALKAV